MISFVTLESSAVIFKNERERPKMAMTSAAPEARAAQLMVDYHLRRSSQDLEGGLGMIGESSPVYA
jgi:hypothetical protein